MRIIKSPKLKKATLVFDCPEVSQGPQGTVAARKGILTLPTAGFLVIWLRVSFLFLNCQLWMSFDREYNFLFHLPDS